MQNYSSFVEYALETYNSSVGAPIPLPVVHATGVGQRLSIPIITIIGAQVDEFVVCSRCHEIGYHFLHDMMCTPFDRRHICLNLP